MWTSIHENPDNILLVLSVMPTLLVCIVYQLIVQELMSMMVVVGIWVANIALFAYFEWMKDTATWLREYAKKKVKDTEGQKK